MTDHLEKAQELIEALSENADQPIGQLQTMAVISIAHTLIALVEEVQGLNQRLDNLTYTDGVGVKSLIYTDRTEKWR